MTDMIEVLYNQYHTKAKLYLTCNAVRFVSSPQDVGLVEGSVWRGLIGSSRDRAIGLSKRWDCG
jgi:hypothetical protein